MTDLASVMRERQLAAHTPQPTVSLPPLPEQSPEVASLKDGFRYGLALGFVVGLGAALVVFVAAILVTQ